MVLRAPSSKGPYEQCTDRGLVSEPDPAEASAQSPTTGAGARYLQPPRSWDRQEAGRREVIRLGHRLGRAGLSLLRHLRGVSCDYSPEQWLMQLHSRLWRSRPLHP